MREIGDGIVSYQWDFDNDTNFDSTTAVNTIAHSYAIAGNQTIALKVTDGLGDFGTTSGTITVKPNPSITSIVPTVGRTIGSTATTITGSDFRLTATKAKTPAGSKVFLIERYISSSREVRLKTTQSFLRLPTPCSAEILP